VAEAAAARGQLLAARRDSAIAEGTLQALVSTLKAQVQQLQVELQASKVAASSAADKVRAQAERILAMEAAARTAASKVTNDAARQASLAATRKVTAEAARKSAEEDAALRLALESSMRDTLSTAQGAVLQCKEAAAAMQGCAEKVQGCTLSGKALSSAAGDVQVFNHCLKTHAPKLHTELMATQEWRDRVAQGVADVPTRQRAVTTIMCVCNTAARVFAQSFLLQWLHSVSPTLRAALRDTTDNAAAATLHECLDFCAGPDDDTLAAPSFLFTTVPQCAALLNKQIGVLLCAVAESTAYSGAARCTAAASDVRAAAQAVHSALDLFPHSACKVLLQDTVWQRK